MMSSLSERQQLYTFGENGLRHAIIHDNGENGQLAFGVHIRLWRPYSPLTTVVVASSCHFSVCFFLAALFSFVCCCEFVFHVFPLFSAFCCPDPCVIVLYAISVRLFRLLGLLVFRSLFGSSPCSACFRSSAECDGFHLAAFFVYLFSGSDAILIASLHFIFLFVSIQHEMLADFIFLQLPMCLLICVRSNLPLQFLLCRFLHQCRS